MPLAWAVALSVVAGAGLELAGAPTGWWPVAFGSVTLGLWTLIGRSAAGALLVGATFGAVFFGVHLAWVGAFLGPLPWVALVAVETALFAVGAVPVALALRWTHHWRPGGALQLLGAPLLVAGLWTAREPVMGAWPYGGFPWSRLATTQVDGPAARLVSWVGVSGLTFVMVLLCAVVLQWAVAGGAHRLRRAGVASAVVLLLVAVPQYPTQPAGSLRVGWVQGQGPAGSFDARRTGDVLDAQLRTTRQVLGRPMDLLVWPEGGVDTDPLQDAHAAAALDAVAAAAGAPVLVNAATTRTGRTFNTSLLWTRDPRERQSHDKAHPVPFGEHVPDRWLFEALAPELVGLLQREFTAGEDSPVVDVDGRVVGLAICFDVIYDDVIRRGALEGAQVYVFQTNDADFRGTAEGEQQLAIARMRAVETGRAVVDVTTAGPSGVFAPGGSPLAGAGTGVAVAGVTTVPLRTGLTPAVRMGAWPSLLVSLASLTLLVTLGVRRARPGDGR